jgi:hypothetical protein
MKIKNFTDKKQNAGVGKDAYVSHGAADYLRLNRDNQLARCGG